MPAAPPWRLFLAAVKIPSVGGDTQFVDMVASLIKTAGLKSKNVIF